MSLSNFTLTTTPSSLFTSVGNTNAVIVIYICNTHPTDTITFNLYAVPAGGQADGSTIFYKDVNLTAGDTYVLDTERLILDAGDGIWGDASAALSLVVTVNTIVV
jgi:hypothetical protein